MKIIVDISSCIETMASVNAICDYASDDFSLQFDCSRDVTLMEVLFLFPCLQRILHPCFQFLAGVIFTYSWRIEFLKFRRLQEQFFIMKPKEITNRSFKLYPTTDQASKYSCSGMTNARILRYQWTVLF